MILRVLSTVCSAAILLFTAQPISVMADVAPPEPASGSDPVPSVNNTNVRMVSEFVLLDITQPANSFSSVAYVTAQFFMQNMGNHLEVMKVRFPLNSSHYYLEESFNYDTCGYTYAPFLEDFSVQINDQVIPHEISEISEVWPDLTTDSPEDTMTITFPCWAHFDAIFPPGVVVKITVKYTQADYNRSGDGTVEFPYVIGTGAGWFDTIGEADIIARLPYPVDPLNFDGCRPDDCTIEGTDIRFHYENFEPEGNLIFYLLRPGIWQTIQTEKEIVAEDPGDGEAWGRLGKVYKDAIRDSKGFLGYDHPFYELSVEAYEIAVNLLPEDPDWHYGFADLLCWGALTGKRTDTDWAACLIQLKATLDLDPDHELALELLNWLNSTQGENWVGLHRPLVDITGPDPIFLFLTPQPTSTPIAVITAVSPTPTSSPTHQPSPATQVADLAATATQVEPTGTIAASETAPVNTTASSGNTSYKLLLLLILISISLYFLLKRRRS